MAFQFDVANATKISAVTLDATLAAATVPTDGGMAPNTILNGLLGTHVRLKYVSAGEYRNSTFSVDLAVH
jgi:hypothetical protein